MEKTTPEFNKDKARETFFSSHPGKERYLSLDLNVLKQRIVAEKRRNEKLALKEAFIVELLSLRELNKEVQEGIANKVSENKEILKLEYQRIRTRDYFHEKLSKRVDYKAMTRERNRLVKQKKEKLKRLPAGQ